MKWQVCLLAALVVAGCGPKDSDPVRACEHMAMVSLASPSSYKLVSAKSWQFEGRPMNVFIEFDASNVFGAIVRGQAECEMELYEVVAGSPDLSGTSAATMLWRITSATIDRVGMPEFDRAWASYQFCLEVLGGGDRALTACPMVP